MWRKRGVGVAVSQVGPADEHLPSEVMNVEYVCVV